MASLRSDIGMTQFLTWVMFRSWRKTMNSELPLCVFYFEFFVCWVLWNEPTRIPVKSTSGKSCSCLYRESPGFIKMWHYLYNLTAVCFTITKIRITHSFPHANKKLRLFLKLAARNKLILLNNWGYWIIFSLFCCSCQGLGLSIRFKVFISDYRMALCLAAMACCFSRSGKDRKW